MGDNIKKLASLGLEGLLLGLTNDLFLVLFLILIRSAGLCSK
jgi:hypothetical protein